MSMPLMVAAAAGVAGVIWLLKKGKNEQEKPREYVRIVQNYRIFFGWQEHWVKLGIFFQKLLRTDCF